MGTLRERLEVWQLLAGTTGLTAVLIVLGVYTAATGAGLACAQQWPLCDGGVLPQTLPSFVEWFHRLVAMVAGFAVLGSAAAAVRWSDDRRVAAAAVAALVLLPVQIGVGAVTVTIEGLIPWGYSTTTHLAHLLLALAILGALSAATLYALGDRLAAVSRLSAAAAAVTLLVASVPFARGVGLAYTVEAQALYYLLVLGVVVAAAVTAWPRPGEEGWPVAGRLAAATLPALVVQLLVARDVALFGGILELAYYVAIGLALALLAGATLAARLAVDAESRTAEPAGD